MAAKQSKFPRVGLLIRAYNKKGKPQEDIDKDIARAVKNAQKALNVTVGGHPVFTRIIFLVPIDHDYGGTYSLLRTGFAQAGIGEEVDVIEVHGHHSREALNQGLRELAMGGVEYREVALEDCEQYGVVVSGKAIDYVKPATMKAMFEAFALGAKVVGVATDELAEIVGKGRIQNTFAGWDLGALFALEPSGFDSLDGVEEYAPAARLVRKHGRCIAVLEPSNLPKLDIRNNPDGKARHAEVMNTKSARQLAEAERTGISFAETEAGMMPGYPKQV